MKIPTIIASAIICTAVPAVSQAATLTYDEAFSNLSVSASAQSSGVSALGTFSDSDTASLQILVPQFDMNLGTLNSVQFAIDLSTNSTDASFNVAALTISVGTIELDRSLSFTVSGIDDTLGSGTADLSGAPLASLLGITLNSLAGIDGSLSDNPAVGSIYSDALTSLSDLNAVTGSGNLVLTLSATDLYQYTTILGLGQTSWGGETTYAGVASVTYNYTPVPEPGSFSLLVAGAAGILVLRRQRRRC